MKKEFDIEKEFDIQIEFDVKKELFDFENEYRERTNHKSVRNEWPQWASVKYPSF